MSRWLSRWGVVLLVLLFPTSGQSTAGEEKATATGQQEKTSSDTSLIDSLSFTSRKEPIHIRSRDLEFRYEEKRITYRGDVVATQGDTTLKSDTLIVTYEESPTGQAAAQPKPDNTSPRQAAAQPKPDNTSPRQAAAQPKPDNTSSEKGAAQPKPQNTSSQQQLKEIVAEGNVDITSGARHATAKKAVFTQATRTVVLTGNAVLQDTENQVVGEKVTVFLDEKRTVVEGGGEKPRVEMVVSRQQEGGKKGEKTP
jgi:lipopolysaccharide export system protein LptA